MRISGRGARTAPETEPSPALRVTGVEKSYGRGDGRVAALRGVDLRLERGSFVAVMGPSGSGKSTLLRLAAGLEPSDSGRVELAGVDITGMREMELAEVRRTKAAFVFQNYNLMPTLTVRQNLTLPLRLRGRRPEKGTVDAALEAVGLADRARVRPGQLSGGQQQRIAVARALVQRAPVLFADEPTGALDRATGDAVLRVLSDTVGREGRCVLMVTHDPVAAAFADRVVFLVDGRIRHELRHPDAGEIAAWLTARSA
ncbi:ABC transporter ATP-binding protein [Streptomyces sp. ZYX-F-203]